MTCQRDKWHSATREAVTKWEKAKNAKEGVAYEEKKAGEAMGGGGGGGWWVGVVGGGGGAHIVTFARRMRKS